MPIPNIFPNSFLNSGIKSLLSNDNILAFFKKFCDEITSRMWKFKRAKNSRYEDIDLLKVFFFSEIIGRLGRHLKACSKRPDGADEEKEAKFLSGELRDNRECPYCKEEFVSLGRHLSYCRKKYKKMFRKIYKTLLELSKNFTRIHLQELVNKTKIYN